MDITITVSDGTTTEALTITSGRAKVTADALSAAVGDVEPPANNVEAIERALARWIGTTREQYRSNRVARTTAAALDATLASIRADEAAARP